MPSLNANALGDLLDPQEKIKRPRSLEDEKREVFFCIRTTKPRATPPRCLAFVPNFYPHRGCVARGHLRIVVTPRIVHSHGATYRDPSGIAAGVGSTTTPSNELKSTDSSNRLESFLSMNPNRSAMSSKSVRLNRK